MRTSVSQENKKETRMRVMIVAVRGVRTSVLGTTVQIRDPAQNTSYSGEPSAQDPCCRALSEDSGYGSSAGKSKKGSKIISIAGERTRVRVAKLRKW